MTWFDAERVREFDATKVVITLRRDDSVADTRPGLSLAVTSSAHHAERDGYRMTRYHLRQFVVPDNNMKAVGGRGWTDARREAPVSEFRTSYAEWLLAGASDFVLQPRPPNSLLRRVVRPESVGGRRHSTKITRHPSRPVAIESRVGIVLSPRESA